MQIWMLVVVLALAVLTNPGDGATPEEDVRGVVARFGEASAEKDYRQICDALFARKLVDNVEQYGKPCELALREGWGKLRAPQITAGAVTVEGDRASARITTEAASQFGSTDTLVLRLVDGEWRIAALE